jgi:beta-lactamase regulating signal transducer with metallopeptidase domain
VNIVEPLLLARLAPSITVVLTTFGLVLLFVKVFHVRNAGLRYVLFHLPLVKGLMVLLTCWPASFPEEAPLYYGARIPDLLRILPPVQETGPVSTNSFVLAVVAAAAVVSVVCFLIYRWASLYHLYVMLSHEEEAHREDFPALFSILDRLVPAFGVPYPRLVLISRTQFSPCSVGWRRPVILLLPDLLDALDESELEAVLAHELAHIRRRDGLVHWFGLGLRDLMFFNPFAWLVFGRLLLEKEKACDRGAIAATENPKVLAHALLDVSLMARRDGWATAPGGLSMSQQLVRRTLTVRQRIAYMLQGSNEVAAARWQWTLSVFFALVVIFVQVYLQIAIGDRVLVLQ